MKAQPKASHFVDGAYVEDSKGAVIDVIYPATGEVIARVHEATPAVIEAALASANRAQAAWAATRPVERARILRRAADLIRERNPELARGVVLVDAGPGGRRGGAARRGRADQPV